MVSAAHAESSVGKRLVGGIVGGIAGGIVFGMLMAMMGMFPLIASMVGSSNPVVGFLVHMMISIFIGATFGLIFGGVTAGYGRTALFGLVYGIVWWVLGPLLIMPTMMGMGPQFAAALTVPNLMSLMGHMIYGIVTGLGYAWYTQRH